MADVDSAVKEAVIEALGLDDDELTAESTLMDDLGAKSIDLLDILFRIEKSVGVKIEASDLGDYIQGGIPDDEFTDEGRVISAKGAEQLHKVMPQADPSDLEGKLRADEVMNLLTVQNLIDMVKARADAPAAEPKLRVGIDAVGVARLERLVAGDERRQATLFTEGELAYCRGKRRCYEHMAARFAAKEAVLKVLGTGWRGKIAWTDVEVVKETSGQPRINLTGECARIAQELGIYRWHVSISHIETHATASAIGLRGDA